MDADFFLLCHPDRSAAEWRGNAFAVASVIPSGAEGSWFCFVIPSERSESRNPLFYLVIPTLSYAEGEESAFPRLTFQSTNHTIAITTNPTTGAL